MEIEPNLATIKKQRKDGSFPLLKHFYEKSLSFLEEIKNNSQKNLEDFIENYYFLKYLKENKTKYQKENIEWNYDKNLDTLKETLTNAQYQSLVDSNMENPLEEIILILNEFINIKKLKKKQNRINQYHALVKKYPKNFNYLNFPLIFGIERLRMKYYRDLLVEKNISEYCSDLKSYLSKIKEDKEIFEFPLDNYKFNKKMFLLVLTLTKTFNVNKSDLISDFFAKNINNSDNYNYGTYKNIKLLKEDEYIVTTKFETRNIKGKDYILTGLERDITNHCCYPLEVLLLRNESFQKFEKDGGKGFLHKLNLYDSFINYIKYFIKSKTMKQILKDKNYYLNIERLLDNDYYLNEMLDETHFGFLPFYGSQNHFGFTNKDLLILFINSIPEIADNLAIEDKEEEEGGENVEDIKEMEGEEEEEKEDKKALQNKIQNLTNICLLLSIGVKFITSLHELVINFTLGYLHYFSEKKLNFDSFKAEKEKDGDFNFEKQLNNGNRFDYLDINSVIILLDGSFCKKDLSDFRNDLKSEIDIEALKKRIDEGKIEGFLKDFLDKYHINFDYFKDRKFWPQISCRKSSDIGIFMNRSGSCSYGGGKSKLKE